MFTACISFSLLLIIIPSCLYLPPCSEEVQIPAEKTGKLCPWREEQEKDCFNKPNCNTHVFYGEDTCLCPEQTFIYINIRQ